MDNSSSALIVLALKQCCEILFSSSSEESEDDCDSFEYTAQFLLTKNEIPRLQNYVEIVVPKFNNRQFKSHFRYEIFSFSLICY